MATFQDLPEDLKHSIREIVKWYHTDERQDLAQFKQDTGEDNEDHVFHHLDRVNAFVLNEPYIKKEAWQTSEYLEEDEGEIRQLIKGDTLITAYDFKDCLPVSMDPMFPSFENRVSDLFIDEGVCSRVSLNKKEEKTMRKVFERKGSEMLLDNKDLIFLAPSMEEPLESDLLSVPLGAYRAYYPGFILRLL